MKSKFYSDMSRSMAVTADMLIFRRGFRTVTAFTKVRTVMFVLASI